MALKPDEAIEQTRLMLGWRKTEHNKRLDRLHAYYRGHTNMKGRYRFAWMPADAPVEIRRIADIAQVNVLALVVDSMTQALYVDGYRSGKDSDNQPAWELWQKNRMDKHQMGVHRAAMTYGSGYSVVLPGDSAPAVIRGASPRKMTTVYGEDEDWPVWALEHRRSEEGEVFRLFDDENAYWMGIEDGATPVFLESRTHGMGVVPVIRFLPREDLDDEVVGDIEDLIPIQDQISITTFSLLVAQHYGAHKQRYIMGWLAKSEEEKLKASADKIWTFEDPDVKVGEFAQTQLEGYIQSREASIRHLAAVSQTPVHELSAQLVNLSADALLAAETSSRRKASERQVMFGESWEQTLELGGSLAGFTTDPKAEVRWRDTEPRSLSQLIDALGKIASQLQVPVEELWERIPGTTQTDIARWKKARAKGDALAQLNGILNRQMGGAAGGGRRPPAAADQEESGNGGEPVAVAD